MDEWKYNEDGDWYMERASGADLWAVNYPDRGYVIEIDIPFRSRLFKCNSAKPYKTLGGCQRGAVAFAERMGL